MKPLLIIDFEATSWGPDERQPEPPSGRRYASEFVEFGCILMTRPDQVERTWQSHVRPTDYPLLSHFCTGLTGITRAQVGTGPTFDQAL